MCGYFQSSLYTWKQDNFLTMTVHAFDPGSSIARKLRSTLNICELLYQEVIKSPEYSLS